MKKYVYENAIVYVTIPTEAQLENIRKSTEQFVRKLAKKGLIDNDFQKRRSSRRVGSIDINARRRD